MAQTVPANSSDACVAEKLEPSLVVVDQLRQQKLDLNRVRLVSHFFYGPKKSLKKIVGQMTAHGYTVDEFGDDQLVLKSWVLVDEAWVRGIIPVTCKAAADADLTYDGWDVDVSADHIQASTK